MLAMNDRSFDLVLLSNWEDQIIYGPGDVEMQDAHAITTKDSFGAPINHALESGIWTQSIIWDDKTPFRDFTQIEFNHEDDIVPEDRASGDHLRSRKRMRLESGQPRDKFNLSNDHLYEVSKEGAKHRVRQTFGQLVVQHAYPAQKLQLPFVSQGRSA